MKVFITKNNTSSGFTIIEMLVSIAIFMVVIVLGMTATMSMINANRKSQSSTIILSNLSLAIEAMTKAIRVGTGYTTDSGGTYIEFTPASGTGRVRYSFSNRSITRTTNGNYTAPITAPEVTIENVKFEVRNTAGDQPSVLMKVQGIAGTKVGTESRFYLQSLISQRLITSL